METKIELNKKIRTYTGSNSFIISLQKRLKSKDCDKIEVGKKMVKILSDKQYEVANSILS